MQRRFYVRRPLRCNGVDYKPGDTISGEEIKKLLRWESLVHTGMLVEQR